MNTNDAIAQMRGAMREHLREKAGKPTPAAAEVKTETPDGNLPPGQRRPYILAGKSTFTIQSTKTTTRFTYSVTKAPDGRCFFVAVLTGTDNNVDYSYIGIIDINSGMFRTTAKSRFPIDSPSVRAFGWFSAHMESVEVSVWHNGHRGRCGRKLTVPSSINAGIGPDCAEKGL